MATSNETTAKVEDALSTLQDLEQACKDRFDAAVASYENAHAAGRSPANIQNYRVEMQRARAAYDAAQSMHKVVKDHLG